MDDCRELLVVEAVLPLEKFLLQMFPDDVVLEVVLLDSEGLCDLDKRSGEELRDPRDDVREEDLVNSLIAHLEHGLQPLLRQLHYLLECPIELALCELVGIPDDAERLVGPLLIKECLGADLFNPLCRHVLDVDLVVLLVRLLLRYLFVLLLDDVLKVSSVDLHVLCWRCDNLLRYCSLEEGEE